MHSADDFAQHFNNKVEKIRSSTAAAPPPVMIDRTVMEPMMSFEPVTSEQVAAALKKAPTKHCSLDPVPTWLVKQCSAVFAPVIANMCITSFNQSSLPAGQKMAITRPLLKKPTLDSSDMNSYRPISNLSFLSKMIERLVDFRLVAYADRNSLLPKFQSAYRAQHSTETALVCLYNDMVGIIDRREVGALVLLDMSSAFDTIDHDIMIDVLQRRFDIHDAALAWFRSYFADRTQIVVAGPSSSAVVALAAGVPQGSVLGPRSFVAYAEDVSDVFDSHHVAYHLFADDMQGTRHAKPLDAVSVVVGLENCVSAVNGWCDSRRLQLNTGKTEVMWFGSAANLKKLPPNVKQLHFGVDTIEPVDVVRDLGVFFDPQLTMKAHVSAITRTCFYHLRRLRAIRGRLGQEVTARLVSAFVLSRLDYCNSILAGLPMTTLAPLQRVLHSAARLVLGLKPWDHVTAALRDLHWLPIRQRIDYKLCLLVHRAVTGQAPSYLSELLTVAADVPGRASLRSSAHHDLIQPRTRLKAGERAFSVAAPRAWNNLPNELKKITDTKLFKTKLKTFLFTVAYP